MCGVVQKVNSQECVCSCSHAYVSMLACVHMHVEGQRLMYGFLDSFPLYLCVCVHVVYCVIYSHMCGGAYLEDRPGGWCTDL